MARNRIIGAASMREVRKPSRVADAAAHAEYREMIAAEIGTPDFRTKYVDDGRPVGLFALLTRPLALFLMSVLALATVYTWKLWREGWFERFRAPEAPAPAVPETHWIAGHGEPRPVEDRVPTALPEPKAAPAPAEEAAPEGEADPPAGDT